MFHCNGWCVPWAVRRREARTSACARSTRAHLGALRRRGRDALQRCADRALGIVGHDGAHPLEQRVTVPTAARRPRRRSLARMREPTCTRASLRADRDLRPGHGLQPASGVGRAATTEEQAELLSRQGQTYNGSDLVRVVDDDMRDVPRRRRDRSARSSCAATASCVATGTCRTRRRRPSAAAGSTRRPRRAASRRLRRAARPRQGRDHLRRREHLQRRDRAGRWPATPPSTRRRSWRCRTRSGASC